MTTAPVDVHGAGSRSAVDWDSRPDPPSITAEGLLSMGPRPVRRTGPEEPRPPPPKEANRGRSEFPPILASVPRHHGGLRSPPRRPGPSRPPEGPMVRVYRARGFGFALAFFFVSARARTAGASSLNSPRSHSRAAASTSLSGNVFEVNSPYTSIRVFDP